MIGPESLPRCEHPCFFFSAQKQTLIEGMSHNQRHNPASKASIPKHGEDSSRTNPPNATRPHSTVRFTQQQLGKTTD